MSKRNILLVSITFISGLILNFVAPRPVIEARPIAPAPNLTVAQDENTCQAILTAAMQSLETTCMALGRNNACYGNNRVHATPRGNVALAFELPGDKVAIQDIESISTSPLDATAGTWGLSLLKLQANLPDTMPGQNVMFLVYGDTTVQNTSGDMRAFYFSSGLGNLNCKEAPDGIVVRSPHHAQVTFTANGVNITIASTIILRAAPNKTLDVQLIEGHAQVSAPAGTQILTPGEVVSVPLGGASGLEPVGAPSIPAQTPADPSVIALITASDQVMAPEVPTTITVENCISQIENGVATVAEYKFDVDPNNPALNGLKIGDCLHIEGTLASDGKGNIVISPVAITPISLPAAGISKGGNAGKGSNNNAGVTVPGNGGGKKAGKETIGKDGKNDHEQNKDNDKQDQQNQGENKGKKGVLIEPTSPQEALNILTQHN
jgi:hypothetical protein